MGLTPDGTRSSPPGKVPFVDKNLKQFANRYQDPLELASALISEGISIFETEEFKDGSQVRLLEVVPMDDSRGYHIMVYSEPFWGEEEDNGT